MRHSKKHLVLARASAGFCLASCGLLTLAPSARALTIVPIFDSIASGSGAGDTTTASDPNAAVIEATINQDIATLDSYIANPGTVNVTFEELPATSNGLADSSTPGYLPSYSSYLTALKTQQTLSSADNTAIASLGAVTSSNPVNGNASVDVKGTLLTALGYNDTPSTGSFVEFNPANTFYSRATPVIGKYDLQSAIAHELDEILGIGGSGSTLTGGGSLTDPVGALDLYRYSASGVRSYSTSSSSMPYFSIDGGSTRLVNFNANGAAGSDFSDWGNSVYSIDSTGNTPNQVQDAYSSSAYDGTNISDYPNLGANELTALDVVGWNLTPAGTAIETGSVPEPASIGLLAVGAMGLLARRRRGMD
jgi:hypothetical protein